MQHSIPPGSKTPGRMQDDDTTTSRRGAITYSNTRTVDDLTGLARQYRKIIEQLFPWTSLELLSDMTREQLVALILAGDPSELPQSPSPMSSSATPTRASSSQGDNLEMLQIIPPVESRNSYVSTDLINTISDDINALSLSPRQPSCYLGIASTSAVFKVIKSVDPTFRPPDEVQDKTSKSDLPPTSLVVATNVPHFHDPMNSHASGLPLINAFFDYVHQFTPLLDETEFRHTYLLGVRRDDRWLALLNTVFALGSISICGADRTCHSDFFQQAMAKLSLESLGDVHLETVQILALLAGHYLHFVSQPNLAYSLTGVAIRMATALGLHKDFSNHYGVANRRVQASSTSLALRQRIWWSLFIVDTWGCMTLGRPTFGRLGRAISVKLPKQVMGQNPLNTVSLIENVRFCKIATEIQDHLATNPTIPYDEIDRLDNQLTEWYEHIPLLLKAESPCDGSVMIAGTTLRWRFHNLRILLHRPTFLKFAIRKVPFRHLCDKDRSSIQKCRSTALETIQDIASTSVTNPTMGRAVVWWIFQASLVPLLGLFVADNTLPAEDPAGTPESCRAQVETVISTLLRMERWARTARRTSEVVSQILNAAPREPSRDETAENEHFPHGPLTESSLNLPDQSLWDSINWANDDEWSSAVFGFDNSLWPVGTDWPPPS
ncbi:hypothetical protein V493_03294 [Pseudogymnoascus sp. VKM F-4281 (FW-2241)]|nr:hypothetical protein V493_03294 [Pseudogymnoascus sp. VKM F-4281 (FW-2241)]